MHLVSWRNQEASDKPCKFIGWNR